MDRRFLMEVAEAYFIKHNIYKDFDKKQITQIKETVTQEIISLVDHLYETDIELYDKLCDRPKTFQQRIITDYLDMCYADNPDEIFNEIALTTAAGVLLGVIVMYLYSGSLSKATMKIIANIGKGLEHIGKVLTRRGRYWKFRYAIVQRNAEQCYRACGVTDKDTRGILTYINTSRDSLPISTKDSLSKGLCLAECYVQYSIEAINLLSQSYFMCLRKTGENLNTTVDKDDLLKMISGLKLSTACKEYYDELNNSFTNFYQLLDYVYGDKEDDKQKAIKKLREKVFNSRREMAKTKNFNKFK